MQQAHNIATYRFDGTAAVKAQTPRLTLVPRTNQRTVGAPVIQREHATLGVKLFSAVVAALLVASLAFSWAVGQEKSAREFDALVANTPARCISAMPGDTLWSIASKHQLPGYSVQETVTWIIHRNNLESSYIDAGQLLEIPNI